MKTTHRSCRYNYVQLIATPAVAEPVSLLMVTRTHLEWMNDYARNSDQVQAHEVEHHAECLRSSPHAAQNELTPLSSPHLRYSESARETMHDKQPVRRTIFRFRFDPHLVEEIRVAANGKDTLNSAQYQEQIAAAFARCAAQWQSVGTRNIKRITSH